MLIFAASTIGGGGLGGNSFGSGFMVLWMLVIVGIIGYHVFNAVTGKGYTESIDFDVSVKDGNSEAEEKDDSVAGRLLKLDSLKERDLVSDEEYEEERQRILSSL